MIFSRVLGRVIKAQKCDVEHIVLVEFFYLVLKLFGVIALVNDSEGERVDVFLNFLHIPTNGDCLLLFGISLRLR